MKIVVLDGYAMNPGDLTWSWLNKYGTYTVYDRTEAQQAVERIGDAEAILINKVPITEDVMNSCPNLRYIGVNATGYNVVDISYAHKKGITVTNVPGYSTSAVAQQVFAFILAFSNRVTEHNDSVYNGDWIACPDFTYWKTPLCELEGKILGIIGFGAIGKKTAIISTSFWHEGSFSFPPKRIRRFDSKCRILLKRRTFCKKRLYKSALSAYQ